MARGIRIDIGGIFIAVFKDYTGEKINNWIILKHLGFNKHGESIWNAECDCKHKTEVEKVLSSLKRFGKCSTCVKDEKLEERKKELIGQTYGKLTIIDYYGYRDDLVTKAPFWTAKCDCGSPKEIIATIYDIKKQRIASCGCLLEEYNKKYSSINGSKRKKYNEFIEKEDYYIGISDNGEFLFDKDDYEKIISMNRYWSINNLDYVLCKINNKEYQLHRYIMGLGFYDAENDIIVDHIDGNTLDNRKSNLRITHRKHNPKNTVLYANNTSGHKGISWHKDRQKWQVGIQVDKNNIYLGIFDNLEDAVEVRKEAEIKYFGEFSRDYGDEVIG